ncbi:uncharacterized protein LOC143022559 [Oratosquilla oratoria]|uniref:uncharacterized protein LOC143022559 n=1 Tax=Oratosquilla oratoria TaxID=337810 RepID=UPI003F76192C
MADKRVVSLDLKVEIIKAAEDSAGTQRELAEKFGVSRTTVCVTLQRKKEILREFEDSCSNESSKKEVYEMSKSKVCKYGTCMFCNIGQENEESLGKLYECDDVRTHYYCLLFSSGLEQNGKDEEGILGFLTDDIKKELIRSKKLICNYCTKKGANVGCFSRKCKKSYHFNCGLKHSALFRFHTDFRSYCSKHRHLQNGPNVGEEMECPICFEPHVIDPRRAVWASCCRPKSWFHRECVQRLALSAGYFFKCPLCNDKDTFVISMQNWGVYVPEQDASWELEPNAFQELHERPVHCDAEKCRCPTGRKTDDCGTRWEVLLCSLCGSTGIHIACGYLAFSCKEWHCHECTAIVTQSFRRLQQEERSKRAHSRSKTKEDEIGSDDNDKMSMGSLINNERSRKRKWSMELKKPCIKLPHLEDMICTRISRALDSDEEVDIEGVEDPVPSEVSIKELEDEGKQLPRLMELMKTFITQVKTEMHSLCLTNSNVLQIAHEWKPSDKEPITVDDITKFLNFELSYKKSLLVRSLLRHAFKKREEIISQALAKHADILTPRTTKRIINSGTILSNLAMDSSSYLEKEETTPRSRGESSINKRETEGKCTPVTRGRRCILLENPVESSEEEFSKQPEALSPLGKEMDKENIGSEDVACSSKSLSEERTVSCTSERFSPRRLTMKPSMEVERIVPVAYHLCIICQNSTLKDLRQSSSQGLHRIKEVTHIRMELLDYKHKDILNRLMTVMNSGKMESLFWHKQCYAGFTHVRNLIALRKHRKRKSQSIEATTFGNRSEQNPSTSCSYIAKVIIASGISDYCLNCSLVMDIRADYFFVTLSCGTVHIRCQHCFVWNIMLDVF